MSNKDQELQELQISEHNLQNINLQKQAFQLELNETELALSEIDKTQDEVYRIIGQIMLKSNKEDLKKELEEKKNILSLRIKSLDKQELSLNNRVTELRTSLNNSEK